MIGRPYYVEDNVVYDETPKIFGDVVNDKMIKVD